MASVIGCQSPARFRMLITLQVYWALALNTINRINKELGRVTLVRHFGCHYNIQAGTKTSPMKKKFKACTSTLPIILMSLYRKRFTLYDLVLLIEAAFNAPSRKIYE
ncbi:hypothetical protein [Nitrospira sp. M1]